MSARQPAARVGDPIAHSSAGLGMLIGALAGVAAGALLVGATIGTGGLALVAAVGAGAALTSFGGLKGMSIGAAVTGPACGALVTGSANVMVNRRPATMTAQATASCSPHGTTPLATGSASVFINGKPAGRLTEKVGCSALVVAPCSPNVMIGGPTAADPAVEVTPEVPDWAVNTLAVLGIAGGLATLPYAVATLGVAATFAGGAAGWLGGIAGGRGMRAAGEAMGLSEAGVRAMEAAGELGGGMVAGAAGVRGAGAAQIAARRSTAQGFYKELGWPQARIDAHMKGIDFSKPVRVVDLDPAADYGQWQVPGGSKGNYFAPSTESPGRLGISSVGHDPASGAVSKTQTIYRLSEPTRALESRAAAIEDSWSNPYATGITQGGGTQYFVHNPSVFVPK